MPTQVSKNFALTEWVHPSTAAYKKRGDGSISLLDQRIVEVVQHLRDELQSANPNNQVMVLINGKCPTTGHIYTESGLRDFQTSVGAEFSQHKFGRAADVKCYVGLNGVYRKLTPKEVYDFIMAREMTFMSIGLTTMEDIADTPTWNHLDCRWWGQGIRRIQIVKP